MTYREKYERRRIHDDKICCLKMLVMWLFTVLETIIATLILNAYPLISGILYALAGENIFRMADFYDDEEDE